MKIRITTAAVLALLAAGSAGAQQYAAAGGAATGSITISGSSTVRDWSCTVGNFEAAVRTPDTSQPMPSGRESASFVIPVNGIDCRNGTMNNHLREALHGQRHPNVRISLDSYTLVDGSTMRAQGELTVGGRTTPIELIAAYTVGEGTLTVRGSKELRMTELGVEPPTLMLGTLRVRDRVTVSFDLVIRQSAVTLAALTAAERR